MILTRVCRYGISPVAINFLKSPVVPKNLSLPKIQVARLYSNEGRTAFTRTARRRGIVEQVTAPAGEGAFAIGKGAIAGGAALGIGALCYYGLGLSSSTGAIDEAALWPQYVKDRIKSTYMYFGGSIALSALTAAACLRSPAVMNIVMRQGWIALGVSMAAMIGTGMVARNIPYQEGLGAKQLAWMAHAGVIGAVLAPLYLIGGPIILRAAWYTAGVVGGLSTVAICAPSDKFLNMAGPLSIGLGVVFASCIGSMFLPPTTAFGAGLHSMALYGGLILFSMFLMYDTQRIIKMAQIQPMEYRNSSIKYYDPVNNAMSIYMDTINIFVRIVSILAGGGNRRK